MMHQEPGGVSDKNNRSVYLHQVKVALLLCCCKFDLNLAKIITTNLAYITLLTCGLSPLMLYIFKVEVKKCSEEINQQVGAEEEVVVSPSELLSRLPCVT